MTVTFLTLTENSRETGNFVGPQRIEHWWNSSSSFQAYRRSSALKGHPRSTGQRSGWQSSGHMAFLNLFTVLRYSNFDLWTNFTLTTCPLCIIHFEIFSVWPLNLFPRSRYQRMVIMYMSITMSRLCEVPILKGDLKVTLTERSFNSIPLILRDL